jgi:hypothetical protein
MTLFDESGILCPWTFPKPLFKISLLIVVLEGYLHKFLTTHK